MHRIRVLEAAAALALTQVLLRLMPFARLAGPISEVDATHLPGTTDVTAAKVGRAVEGAAARLPWHSTCLVRAIAGRWMLRRRGIDSTLVVGVRRTDDGLQAHAWLVTTDGVVCGGRDAAGFDPIVVFSSARR